nr:right-handed parallel beta-helix repeat-containing protein [Limobrevibacterium gyesilva]
MIVFVAALSFAAGARAQSPTFQSLTVTGGITANGLPAASSVAGADSLWVIQGSPGTTRKAPLSLVLGDVLPSALTSGMITGALGYIPIQPGADVSTSTVTAPGGVARTTAAMAGDVINVLNLSPSINNGTTLAATTINAAITAANAMPFGGEVYLPAGKYHVDVSVQNIILKSNVHLRGAGAGKTIIDIDDTNGTLNSIGVIANPQRTNIRVSGITFQGRRPQGVVASGNNLVVPLKATLVNIQASTNIDVYGCEFLDSNNVSLLISKDGSNNIRVRDNRVARSNLDSIAVWNSSNVLIDGNQIEQSGDDSISASEGDGDAAPVRTNVIITNNRVTDGTGGIKINGARSASIRGNKLQRMNTGITVAFGQGGGNSPVYGVDIADNIVEDIYSLAPVLNTAPGGVPLTSYIKIFGSAKQAGTAVFPAWAQSTPYTAGTIVSTNNSAGQNLYLAFANGTSASSGNGPVATLRNNGIVDGTTAWTYLGPAWTDPGISAPGTPIPPWVASKQTFYGQTASNGGNAYIVKSVSALGAQASPATFFVGGSGTSLVDGNITWIWVSGIGNQAYVTGDRYYLGDKITQGANSYQAVVIKAFTASSGGPTGTGTGIVDGDVVWAYTGPAAPGTFTPLWGSNGPGQFHRTRQFNTQNVYPQNIGANMPSPGAYWITVRGNKLTRTLPDVTSLSQWGYGTTREAGQYGSFKTAVTNRFLNMAGIYIAGAMRNSEISDNIIQIGMSTGESIVDAGSNGIQFDPNIQDLALDGLKIRNNTIVGFGNAGIAFPVNIATQQRILVEGNIIEADPYFTSAARSPAGSNTWLSSGPTGIVLNGTSGLLIARNHFRHMVAPITGSGTYTAIGNLVYGRPAAIGYSASNQGVGTTYAAGVGWDYIIEESDPTSAAFGQMLQARVHTASAQPTTGYWIVGQFVANSAVTAAGGKILMGWLRLTTGNGHVTNTDWTPVYSTSS